MESVFVETRGELDIVNLTGELERRAADLPNGVLFVFLKSTTSGLFINEDDPALLEDVRDMLARLVPKNANYRHNSTWGDGNGHSHLRSLLLSNSLALPVEEGRLALGTWQNVFLIELDVRPRRRELVLSFTKEDENFGR
ncbi:secondary thiamine-phosphate synthase enzyme YjbQ [Tardisphaera miroshnichenkoae]